MIYTQLYNQAAPSKTARVGVIGTGHFATATVTQAHRMKRLDVPIVADIDVNAAKRAYHLAGVADENIVIAENRSAALRAIESGQRVIVADAMLLMDLPIDVILESTGVPEVGAHHAQEAIRHGKHVAMVGKETDATVGPRLAQMAQDAGVVYSPVDGDQHGLLIAMIEWARELGLDILCAGKARDAEYAYDPAALTVAVHSKTINITEHQLSWLGPLASDGIEHHLKMREDVLASLPQVGGFDLVEMAIATNATGLLPDRPLGANVEESERHGTLYCPALHTSEIPKVLAPQEYGGILSNRGVIDSVTSLRLPHGAGLGGGVFLVVGCDNDYSRHILTTKGCLSNEDETTALIYRPYHLCGVETPITLLNAALLGQSTLAHLPQQRVDVVARTNRALTAGEIIGNDHSPDLTCLMHLSQPVTGKAPVPIHMANGNRLVTDVSKNAILTADMIEPPTGSVLWALRKEQDYSKSEL